MSTLPFDLSGRVALVTGGGRGIGAAIVTRLAEAGADVVIANRSQDRAGALAAELTDRGLRAGIMPFEQLDRVSLRDLVDEVALRSSRLDILVHNAGGCAWATLDELDEDKLETVLSVNLSAAVWLAQAADTAYAVPASSVVSLSPPRSRRASRWEGARTIPPPRRVSTPSFAGQPSNSRGRASRPIPSSLASSPSPDAER